MRAQPAHEPVFGRAVWDWERVRTWHGQRKAPALLAGGSYAAVRQVWRYESERSVAVLRDQRIEVDDLLNAFRHAVGHPGHHHAAIGMADQGDVAELLCCDEASDVQDVRVQGDLLRQEVGTLAEASQGRGPHAVTEHA